MITLGDKVKDTITGFEGIVTARCVFINGCIQYCIKPKVDKDGKMIGAEWIDEDRLKIVKKYKPPVYLQNTEKIGGPAMDMPPKDSN